MDGITGNEFAGRLAATFGDDYVVELFDRMLPDLGKARQAMWAAEDGYIVCYTTSRVVGGPDDGKFLTILYKPVGKGARSGKADEHVRCYQRAFSTRKAAKERAEALYRQHSPKYAAAH